MDNLKQRMLDALSRDDRAEGEYIRGLMHEEVDRDAQYQHQLINSSFYRMWSDWKRYDQLKKDREALNEKNRTA